MKKNKIRVGVLFGGKSAEHEVSLQSAKNVIAAINHDKYDVVLIGIDKFGGWFHFDQSSFLLNANDPRRIKLSKGNLGRVALVPQGNGLLINESEHGKPVVVDVMFPILHGPFGEDGTVQGLLKIAGVPFVGASVLGSAIGMDKDVMKRLLRDAGLPIAKFLTCTAGDTVSFEEAVRRLGLPLFIKPANMGSSVGVSKVKDQKSFEEGVRLAFRYDNKILIEEHVQGREVECAVLGNQSPIASVVGEVVPHHDFYSYEAKYVDENGAALLVPAKISSDTSERIRNYAILVFKLLSCEGLGRVDFFLKDDDSIIINEINTIPGFTKISMYPRLWEASGISYPELIDTLIQLVIERFEKEKTLVGE